MLDIYFKPGIHETAIIAPGAIIGENNQIGPYVVINDNVIIGDDNYIGPFTVIGEPAEYKKPPINSKPGKVIIGSGNRISEHCAIQAGILTDSTVIKDNCYIMHGVHVGHDCKIADGVVISPLVCLGGSVRLDQFANIGMSAVIHPRLEIGKGSMIGMGSVVTKNVPDFRTWYGIPAKDHGENIKGKERYEDYNH